MHVFVLCTKAKCLILPLFLFFFSLLSPSTCLPRPSLLIFLPILLLHTHPFFSTRHSQHLSPSCPNSLLWSLSLLFFACFTSLIIPSHLFSSTRSLSCSHAPLLSCGARHAGPGSGQHVASPAPRTHMQKGQCLSFKCVCVCVFCENESECMFHALRCTLCKQAAHSLISITHALHSLHTQATSLPPLTPPTPQWISAFTEASHRILLQKCSTQQRSTAQLSTQQRSTAQRENSSAVVKGGGLRSNTGREGGGGDARFASSVFLGLMRMSLEGQHPPAEWMRTWYEVRMQISRF